MTSHALHVGTFIPERPFEPNLSVDPAASVGCLRPALRREVLAALERIEGISWHHDLNFRRAIVRNGDVWCDDVCLSRLDAFVWYCEVHRDAGSFDMDVLRTLERTTRVIRGPEVFLRAVDKFRAHVHLRAAGVRVPDFVLFDHRLPDAMEAVLKEWNVALLKPRLGGWGKGVTLIEHPGQLRDVVDYVGASTGRQSFYLERYVESDLDQWTSVLMIGGQPIYAYRKLETKRAELGAGRQKILDRDERGGEVVLVEPKPEHLEAARRADAALGCGLIGFDMLWTSDGPLIIDENTSPGHYSELFEQGGTRAGVAWARWLEAALRAG